MNLWNLTQCVYVQMFSGMEKQLYDYTDMQYINVYYRRCKALQSYVAKLYALSFFHLIETRETKPDN